MQIWIDLNIDTHDFIPKEYWWANAEYVRNAIPQAYVLVYISPVGELCGFIGVSDGYISGIFIKKECRGMGIGKKLINKCKEVFDILTLDVYLQNKNAIAFYEKNGFAITGRKKDETLSATEYVMTWESERRDRRLLVMAFEGRDNSAHVLLDKLALKSGGEKLALKNSFLFCTNQLVQKLEDHTYERIVAFGQKPIIKNKIYIETVAQMDKDIVKTDYDYDGLAKYLNKNGYRTVVSKNAGNYLVTIFYTGLNIFKQRLDTKMIFVWRAFAQKH